MKTPQSTPPAVLLSSPSFQLERINRKIKEAVDLPLNRYGLSLREYWILSYLNEADAKSQSALSKSLGIDRSDIVRLVDSLEKAGLATRVKDSKDRRRQIITITPKGRKVHDKLENHITKAEQKALDDSTAKQLKQLRKLAEVIISTDDSD